MSLTTKEKFNEVQEIKQAFDKDEAREYLKQYGLVNKRPPALRRQSTLRHNTDYIQVIEETLQGIDHIHSELKRKEELSIGRAKKEDIIEDIMKFSVEFEKQSKVKQKQRKTLVNSILYLMVANFLNDQKNFNHDLIRILDSSLTLLEDKSVNLLNTFKEFLEIKHSLIDLRQTFAQCANLYHREEEKYWEAQQKIKVLESDIKTWLPNFGEYSKQTSFKVCFR